MHAHFLKTTCWLAILLSAAIPLQAQSLAQYLANWDLATDPDAPFNVSTVPLATRFTPTQVNSVVGSTNAGVMSLVSFNASGGNPSQGSQTMAYYAPTYWQYLKQLVYFDGIPTGPVIDAAHRNGVPVLGTIFLAPTVYGGQISVTNELLATPDNGVTFPIADKLIQIAQYYGFEGWFINAETEGGNSTTATRMQQFIKYIHSKAPSMQITWYDAMINTGQILWQGMLNNSNEMFFGTGGGAKVADTMFLDFYWANIGGIPGSVTKANNLGRSPFDLYAGMNMENNSYPGDGTGGYLKEQDWSSLFTVSGGKNKPKVSFGLFASHWTFANATGASDLARMQDFFKKESLFWVGAKGDPSNTSSYVSGSGAFGWKGIANYIQASSVTPGSSFVTNFNTGVGQMYAINGQTLATGGWNNLSLQDVMPTWRWLMTSTGTKLTPELNWEDAYYGGTCLKVSGSTSAVNDLKLYETNLPVAANTNLRIAFKNGQANSASRMKVGLAFTSNPATFTYLDVGSTTSADWNTTVLSLGQFAGSTIATISLRFGDGTALNNYSMKIGQLAIYNGTPSTPAAATGLYVDGGSGAGQLRARWTHSTHSATNLYYYNLYRRNPDNSLSWLGATPNNASLASFTRYGNENFTDLELETVGLDFGTSATRATRTVYVDWDRSAWTLNWQGNGSSNGGAGTWNVNNTNWNSGVPANPNQFWSNRQNDHAVFGATAGTVTLGAAVSANSLEFQSNGYTLTGSNALTMAGDAATITVANAAYNATVSTAIAGNAGLTKSGAGKLTLTATNTYSGRTLVSDGTLQLGDGTAGHDGLIAGNITNNASLVYNLEGTQTLNSVVSGSGALTKSGGGTLAVSKAQTYTGATLIAGGTMKLVTPLIGPAAPVAGYARWFDASNPANLTLNGSTITQWNDLSGNGANATNTTGTRQPTYLSNAVGELGAVHLFGTDADNAGQYLQFNEDANIKSIFVIFKGSGWILTDTWRYDFHRPNNSTGPTAPLWDSVNSSAAIRNGSTYVNGTLVNGTTSAMPTNLNNGFNLVEMLTDGNSVVASTFNRDRNFHNGDQYHAEVLIYDTVLTEAQRLQNEQYLNYKWFGIGSIADPSPSVLPTGTAVTLANGSTLDLNGITQTIGSLSSTDGLGSRVLLGSGTLTTGDANNTTFDGVISGTGSLTKSGAGKLTLTATNTYTGSTTVNGGVLEVNGVLIATSGLGVSSGGTLAGSGTVQAVTVNGGGTLSPGQSATTGTLTTGALTLNSGAVCNFRIGTTSDQVVVGGTLSLNGTINLVDSGSAMSGSYTLFTYSGSMSGTPALVAPSGFTATLDTSTTGMVKVVLAIRADAAPITVSNQSFETTTLAEDGLNWPGSAGWTLTPSGAVAGVFNPKAGGDFFSTTQANDAGPTGGSIGTMTGQNAFFSNQAMSLSQTTAESITVGQQYTLTVAIGQRDVGGFAFGGYTIALYAGSTQLATASSNTVPGGAAGTFADVALTYTAVAGDSGLLKIVLTNNGAGVVTEFDNVRLTTGSAPPADSVTVSFPPSRYLVQRKVSNTGDIPISGTYGAADPDRIEARAVVSADGGNSGSSSDWQVIAIAPSGGTFSGAITDLAAGGWYTLEVRSVTGTTPSASVAVEKIGVGDIYVTAGQSNAANFGSPAYTPADDRVCTRTSVSGASWRQAYDPLPIANGEGGSPWSRLGDLLAAAENIPIGFINVAVGGTAVAEWLPATTIYDNRLKPAVQSLPVSGFRAILWHQGEGDSYYGTSAAVYQQRLTSVIAQTRIDAGWNIPWYVSEASITGGLPYSYSPPILAGQRATVFADSNVFLGPSTNEFRLELKTNDGTHFNAAGLLDHATQWRDILLGQTVLDVENHDFELNTTPAVTGAGALADGTFYNIDYAAVGAPCPLDWRDLGASGDVRPDGTAGYYNPGPAQYANAADTTNGGVMAHMEGRHVAFLAGGSAGNNFLQYRRKELLPDRLYTLTVAVGVRDGGSDVFGGAKIEILANGQILGTGTAVTLADLNALAGGSASGKFTDVTVNYQTASVVASGQPVGVRITKVNGGVSTYLDFDNVRLTATPTVPGFLSNVAVNAITRTTATVSAGLAGEANDVTIFRAAADHGTNLSEWQANGVATVLGHLPAGTLGGSLTGLTADTLYVVRVYAVNAAPDPNEEVWSGPVTFHTQFAAGQKVTDLAASAVAYNRIDLTWSDAFNTEQQYRIERSQDGIHWSGIATLAANTTSFADTGLSELTGYQYRILASRTESGDSDWSNVAQSTTPTRPAGTLTMVADYTFNDNATPAGFTVVGSPSYSGGQLVLDGTQSMSIPTPLTATDNFVIEVICTPSAIDGFNFLVSNNDGANNGWGLLQVSGSYGGIAEGVTQFGSAGAATPGAPVRLALVRDGGVATVYKNGIAVGTTTTASRATPTTFTIGANQYSAAPAFEGRFKGSIDQVRLFTFAPGTFNPATDLLIGPTTGISFSTWVDDTYVPALTLKGPGDDQDGDGLVNLLEFAFGTGPTVADGQIAYVSGGSVTPGVPKIFPNVPASGIYSMVFGRRVDYLATGLAYKVQFSADLDVWVDNNDTTNPPVKVATNGMVDAMSVPYPDAIDTPGGSRKPTFSRVKVAMP